MEPGSALNLLWFLNIEEWSAFCSGLPVFLLLTSLPFWQAVEDQITYFSFFLGLECFLSSFSAIISFNMIQYNEAL